MGFFYDLNSQLSGTPAVPTKDFSGLTVIVTGSNVGLGKEAVKHFARLNAAHIVMAVRTIAKGEAARSEVLSEHPHANISVWHLDMASYGSVREFGQRAAVELDRLDVVVLNAGVMPLTFELAEEDEAAITINVVTTTLLALLLLPVLRRTASTYSTLPVISVVCSNMHTYTSFPERKAADIFANLRDRNKARMSDRYNVSKIMQLFVFRELAARTKDKQPMVVINLLSPGFCKTELFREAHGVRSLVSNAFQGFMGWTAEEGGRTLVLAASGGVESHGAYYNEGKIMPSAVSHFVKKSAEGAQTQQKVWNQLSEKLEKIHPGIMASI